MVQFSPYVTVKRELTAGDEVSFLADDVKLALLQGSAGNVYSFDAQNHVLWSVFKSNFELPATGGYTTGGATLGTKNATLNLSLQGVATAATVQWTSATFTTGGAVLYFDNTPGVDDYAIGYINFQGDVVVSSSTLSIIWNNNGIWTLG